MITTTESTIIRFVFEDTCAQLQRRIPHVEHIDYRRLAYFLIETRRAAYRSTSIRRTLTAVLDEFGIQKPTYYDWREKFYRFLPPDIKNIVV